MLVKVNKPQWNSFFHTQGNVKYTSYVTRIRSTSMTNIQVIRNMTSHVKQEVLELSEYMVVARVLTRPVLAKLCSTAFSVESNICKQATHSSPFITTPLIIHTPKYKTHPHWLNITRYLVRNFRKTVRGFCFIVTTFGEN